MLVIADTSPLYYLILIDEVELLPRLFGRVLIPPVVALELRHSRTPAPIRAWMSSPPEWLDIRPLRGRPEAALPRLGAGEREAIVLAQEVQAALLLMDDLEGREEAVHRAFSVMGRLRVLELAAEHGWLDLPAAIARLQATSFLLDGRDANSYTNVAWIFGLHDRPWPERQVFGKVHYMSAAGLERKCDMPAYLDQVNRLQPQSEKSRSMHVPT